MTTTLPVEQELLPVEQCDREAAADYYGLGADCGMRLGRHDYDALVQAFAKHRIDNTRTSSEVREALSKLERAASAVSAKGAQTGSQWFKLSIALLEARAALSSSTTE